MKGDTAMALDLLARITGVAVLLLLLGAESTQCVDKQMNVTSTADAQDLSDALNCTGGGNFNVTWYGSVAITQTFEVADGISLNVTGSNRSSMALDDGIPPATIRGNELSSDVGMFYVSGASTLTLDNMVLQGVYSEKRRGSGAIEAQGSVNAHLTVNVIDCLFTDNYGYWAGTSRIVFHKISVVGRILPLQAPLSPLQQFDTESALSSSLLSIRAIIVHRIVHIPS